MTDVEPKKMRIAMAVVVGAAIVAFARGLGGDLIRSWHDGAMIVRNENVQHVSWQGFVSFFTEVRYETYAPLHGLSYWLDVPWFGANATTLHAVNLVLFCLAMVCFLRALLAWEIPLVAAVLGTLVLAVHPIQVEAVSWASGRNISLTLLFSALALLYHARARDDVRSAAAWLSRLFVLLAVLSNLHALTLPLVFFLGDAFLRGIPWKRAALAQLPMVGLVAACVFVMVKVGQASSLADEGSNRIALFAATFTHAIETLFWPAHPSPVYRIGHIAELGAQMWTGPLIFLATLGIAAWRRWRALFFVALAFFALLLPVSNLWLVSFQWQDRYLALPLLALAFGVALVAKAFARTDKKSEWPRLPILAVTSLIVVCLLLRSALYVGAWRSDGILWRYAVDAQPNSFHAWYSLAAYRRDRSDFAGAIDAFTRATELEPRQRIGFSGLMSALALRDEARLQLPQSRAFALAELYAEKLDNIDSLQDFATSMLEFGYRDAAYLPLAQWLDAHPMDDDRLERAAQIRIRLQDEPLARFYVSRMRRPPVPAELQALRVRQMPR